MSPNVESWTLLRTDLRFRLDSDPRRGGTETQDPSEPFAAERQSHATPRAGGGDPEVFRVLKCNPQQSGAWSPDCHVTRPHPATTSGLQMPGCGAWVHLSPEGTPRLKLCSELQGIGGVHSERAASGRRHTTNLVFLKIEHEHGLRRTRSGNRG